MESLRLMATMFGWSSNFIALSLLACRKDSAYFRSWKKAKTRNPDWDRRRAAPKLLLFCHLNLFSQYKKRALKRAFGKWEGILNKKNVHWHFSPTHTVSFLSLIPFVSVQCCAYADKLFLPQEWWEYECLFLPLSLAHWPPVPSSNNWSFISHNQFISAQLRTHWSCHWHHTHTHRPPLGLDNTIWIQLQSAWTPKIISLCKYINIYRTLGLQLQIVWNNVILWNSTIPFFLLSISK